MVTAHPIHIVNTDFFYQEKEKLLVPENTTKTR